MSAATIVRVLSLLTVVTLTQACSITPSPVNKEALQKAALARWNDCIERHQETHAGSYTDQRQLVNTRCEGHQRDVLATFPRHLENQVGMLLSQRSDSITTERFLRTRNESSWNIPKSTHIELMKLRSSSALAEDL